MHRYLKDIIYGDDPNKMTLMSGPRQCGKTTLSKQIFSSFDYFNYDFDEDRHALLKKRWRRDVEAILLDEIHKMPRWKEWLKGLYDTQGQPPRLVVTGSANLETFRKVGDSLAGRYFHYHLHPLDIQELVTLHHMEAEDAFEALWHFSGFPEPLLKSNARFHRRWQRTHLDMILRQDFLDLFSVQSIKKIEILVALLRHRVGSTLSYSSLSRDIQASPPSIRQWLEHLESVYAIFMVRPFHKNIARAILKEPKIYFFDPTRVMDEGARLENLVALALLKHLDYLKDREGFDTSLHYLRTKDGLEVDFLLCVEDEPILCVEVKTRDDTPSKAFRPFQKSYPEVPCVQLVRHLKRSFDTENKIMVRDLVSFLKDLSMYDWIPSKGL